MNKYTNGWADENDKIRGAFMRENADNVDMVREQVGVITSMSIVAKDDMTINTYKFSDGEDRIVVMFGNDVRLNMSIEQANELSLKLGFVLQDLEREAKNGKV